MHYVYILQSEYDNTFYKGYSTNPSLRLVYHNIGKSTFTSKKMPWKLVAVFEFELKKEALQKEKKLKKYNSESLMSLINSNQNTIKLYLGSLENY